MAYEIEIAQNEVMARRGEFLPQMGAVAGVGIEKVGEHTSQGVSDEAHDVPEHLQDYKLGLVASWDGDVWKRLRNATKAATLRYFASIEGRRFTATQLVAEVADAYYELLALDNRLSVVQRNIKIQQDALEVVRLQKIAAKVTESAVKRFEAEVLKNQSQQFEILQGIVETENRINFLAGRFPKPVNRPSDSFLEIVPTIVNTGVPSDMLENRPDIKRAELELRAAKLDVSVAKAGFYPSLELRAEVGYQSFSAKRLFDTPASLLYNAAADIMAPLLNRQGLKAMYFSSNAAQKQAVLNYEKTVLNAYNEATNQVAMVDNLAKSYDKLKEQVERLSESIDISGDLFRSARADYMEVLLTRRDALESQLELIETKKDQMMAMVNLYKALGGGWR